MRKSWDEYFLDVADVVATRSTCPRLSVGAVIVQGKRIIATGYNGSKPGEDHCEDVGCLMVDNHCKRTIHAEVNAIQEVRYADLMFSTLYVTHKPCKICQHAIDQTPIDRIVYRTEYPFKASSSEEASFSLLSRMISPDGHVSWHPV